VEEVGCCFAPLSFAFICCCIINSFIFCCCCSAFNCACVVDITTGGAPCPPPPFVGTGPFHAVSGGGPSGARGIIIVLPPIPPLAE
jgi:hypothetical protein